MKGATDINVLAVDDRAANLLAIRAMLEGFDVNIVEASSGEGALARAEDYDFALILLDVRLPGIDGVATAEKLRRLERTKDVPIMFLTAFDGVNEEIERAYSLGAVDFLVKPIVPKMLLSKMAVFIDLYRKNQAIREQARLLQESQEREHERRLVEERSTWEADQLRREVEFQRKIAEEKDRSAVILQCIKEAVVAVDAERRVTLLNQAAEDLFGLTNDSARGRKVDEVVRLLDPTTRKPVMPEDVAGDVVALAWDDTERVIADSVGPVIDRGGDRQGTVFVYRDVTTQRHMERDLHNQQRLESLGYLAGGIAHDFNNMLGMVLASTSILRSEIVADGRGVELIQGIEDTCSRASGLTRQLLTFSRGGAPVKQVCDPEILLRESVEMSLKGSAAHCEYRVDSPLWPAEWDPSQVSQVFSNLVLNAREATGDRGHIVISAKNVSFDSTGTSSLPPGSYIEIRVEDDGPGIAAQDAEMIFDPYFSTKADHRGLGLSSSYSVAKKHGGILKLDLTQTPGASLVLYLPANPDATLETQEVESQDYCTGGHVLVMDDEARLRELLTDCLLAIECRVEGAANGDEAVRKFAAATNRGDPFDVVILDLTIRGGMGGAETLKKLQAIHPKVLAIACSGYANDPVMCEHEQHGFAKAIEKPFRFAVLARAVRSLVGRSQRAPFRPELPRRA